jgi:hypothetical protein
MTFRFSIRAAALSAAALTTLIGSPARATVLDIPAVSMAQTFGAADAVDRSLGLLDPTGGRTKWIAPLPFQGNGQVCRFSIVYRDVNAQETITARLMRKTYALGGSAYVAPTVMARVVSSPSVADGVRRTDAPSIPKSQINTATGFYYVDAEIENINMALIGVQIDVRANCS